MLKTKRLVLVVDDDPAQRETLCRGLLYLGLACLPARPGAEALTQLTGPIGERIDLALVDLSALGKPGARFVEQVMSARPGLPVLVVTGLVVSPAVIALGDRGVPILRKPFTPDQLGRAIETALTRDNDPKEEKT